MFSQVSEGEEDILAQCISSGMPTPTSSARKLRRPSSDSTSKRKSGIPTKSDLPGAAALGSKPSSSRHAPGTSNALGHQASRSSVAKVDNSASSSLKPPRSSSSKSQRHGSNKPEAAKSPSSRHGASPKSGSHKHAGLPAGASHKDLAHGRLPGSHSPQQAASKTPHDFHQTPHHSKPSASKNLTPILNKVAGKAKSPSKKSTSKGNDGRLPVMQDVEEYADFSTDYVKQYATEGTPLNFSNATSLSDLSMGTHSSNSPKKSSSSSAKSPGNDDKSDNSSVCEENEELLLNQMIQSGMPQNKSSRKSGDTNDASGPAGDDNGGGKQRDCNLSAFVPRTSNLALVAPFTDFVAVDSVKTYNVEGTPRNFSAATSLSDLTIDSIEGPGGLTKMSGQKVNRCLGSGQSGS